jgi:hypothetical protein
MATSHLRDTCFDCADHIASLASGQTSSATRFAYPSQPHTGSLHCPLSPAGGLHIWCNQVPEPKVVKNRVHIDINLPDAAEMERLQRLGARALREIHDAEGRLRWTIMADSEGYEFCAFLPRE